MQIPEGAFLHTEGLYIHETTVTVGSSTFQMWELYSAEGWCFYDLQQAENYDEDGNLLPPENRLYARYMSMRKNEAYVAENIVSVPIEEGYEIVSVGGDENHEVM